MSEADFRIIEDLSDKADRRQNRRAGGAAPQPFLHHPRHHRHRRLRLAEGRELAGGAARSLGARCRISAAISRRRTPIPRACSATPPRLQKKLVAEMRGRIKEDDSSVPSPDGPFAYFRKYREGGQHEMIGRSRATAATPHRARWRRTRRKPRLFPVRRRAPFLRSQAAGLERRRQGLGIFHDPRSRLGQRRRTATISSRRPTAAWCGAPIARASSTSSSTTIIARCRSSATGSARRRPTTS